MKKRVPRAFLASVQLLAAGILVPSSVHAENLQRQFVFEGRTRTYEVHLPATAPPGSSRALVVVLHGGGGNARSAAMQTGFDAASDANGFVAIYPDGSGNPMFGGRLLTWNAGSCCAYAQEHRINDVGFIREVVARAQSEFRTDRKRVYATGISNGGMLAYRLACEASDVFAAIAPVSAVDTGTGCAPVHPVSVLHIHGSDDQNVPLAGGVGTKAYNRDVRPPVAGTIASWVRNDHCASPPTTTIDGAVRHDAYTDCAAGSEVSFYLIDGGGHAWPGGQRMRALLDPPSTSLAATPLIWRFFAAHPQQ